MTARLGGLVKSDQMGNTHAMLTSPQIRAARALLDWLQEDLAKKSKVGLATIQRLERGQTVVAAQVATVIKLQSALEKAGIKFLAQDDAGGIGVRLKR